MILSNLCIRKYYEITQYWSYGIYKQQQKKNNKIILSWPSLNSK